MPFYQTYMRERGREMGGIDLKAAAKGGFLPPYYRFLCMWDGQDGCEL